ncbi:ABC transporter substrate-binding protein [Streptomyces sp. NPDC091292]|uniref:ABC transporter substrate-binding protein n=1 Tax=Streptomyces sp. NPDC091292 TaxID=3365991 RepID=UPI0038154158
MRLNRGARIAFPAHFALFALFAFVLAGCGGSGSGQSSGGVPNRVVIAVGGNYLSSYASWWAAHENLAEIERKYGTTISYEPFAKGSDTIGALAGGTAQVCLCATVTALTAAHAGKDLKYVGNISLGSGLLAVGAKKYQAANGTDLASFADKKVGFTAPGSLSQVTARKAMTAAGVDWDKTKQVALGSGVAFAPALMTGRADLITASIPETMKTIDEGAGYLVTDLNDPRSAEPLIGQVLGMGVVVPNDFTQQYPELTQDLVSALVESLAQLRGKSDGKAVYSLMPDEFKKVNPQDGFLRQWKYLSGSFATADGGFTDKAITDTIALAGLDPKSIPEGFFDKRYVDKAYSTLPIDRPAAG